MTLTPRQRLYYPAIIGVLTDPTTYRGRSVAAAINKYTLPTTPGPAHESFMVFRREAHSHKCLAANSQRQGLSRLRPEGMTGPVSA